MNPQDYTNHSGGAQGTDMAWDRIGREYGVTNHIHWRPEHLFGIQSDMMSSILIDVQDAARVLGRPHRFRGMELVHRNWFQVHHAEAIYAIGRVIEPLGLDPRGFVNRSGKQIVAGGTGWAVEMAIQKNKPVHVFDMNTNRWYEWSADKFYPLTEVPILTETFAGIGSRELTEKGEQAIRDAYSKTFDYE